MATLCSISYTNISQKEKNWLVVANGEEVHKSNQKAAEYPEIYIGKLIPVLNPGSFVQKYFAFL